MKRDLAFLANSAQMVVELIQLLERVRDHTKGHAALEIGAGSGWVAWQHEYQRALRRNGFTIMREGIYSVRSQGRLPWVNWLRRRMTDAIRRGDPKLEVLTQRTGYLFAGSYMAIAQKTGEAARIVRPAITPITPGTLRVTEKDHALYKQLLPVLEDAGEKVWRIAKEPR